MKNVNDAIETNEQANLGTTTNEKPVETNEKPVKKAKKIAAKSGTMTTRDMAKILGMTPKQLRRILRDTVKYDDGKYTRYLLTNSDLENVKKKIAGKSGK